MNSGPVIGHIKGIEIRLNWSVVVVAALITWSVAEGVLPDLEPGHSATTYWIVAGALAVAFLAGLIAHELGHSLVALREGVVVTSVTLWLFGGVARLGSSPERPRAALRIAAAGPAVSLVLGVVSLLIAAFLSGLAAAALAWFGLVNLVLAGFNLLPAFPMDGGRIYQAWLWSRSGDEVEATRRAAALGFSIGGAMIALGVVEVLFVGAIGGVWLVMVGWFVREAARAEATRSTTSGPLRAMTVTQVMSPDPDCVASTTTVATFVSDMVLGGRHSTYPVVAPGGSVAGLVSLSAVRGLDRDAWAATPVSAVSSPIEDVITIDPTASVLELLEKFDMNPRTRALVVESDRVVGIVAPADIARLVSALELAGPGSLGELETPS